MKKLVLILLVALATVSCSSIRKGGTSGGEVTGIGAGYRWKDAVTAFIGLDLKDAYVGYAYDYPVSAISKATFGSHEVFVSYRVKLDPKEKNKNKQKSVRLM